METSLHRQLKEVYADQGARLEAPLGNYRIDVICDGELIEIQHGSLAAIRDKVRGLLQDHRVLVVKPIVHRKQIVKRDARGGRVISRRLSPKRGREIDVFDEMIYFTRVFPHPNLTVEAPLVDVEEWRYPCHGRRRRRRSRDHVVEDQKLVGVHRILRFHDTGDLLRLIPRKLPSPFHTAHLAVALNAPRWLAQRIAYCLRETADSSPPVPASSAGRPRPVGSVSLTGTPKADPLPLDQSDRPSLGHRRGRTSDDVGPDAGIEGIALTPLHDVISFNHSDE